MLARLKGKNFYEIQILMWVFLWKHNPEFKPNMLHIWAYDVRLGNFYMYKDPLWLTHGFGRKLRHIWRDVTYYPKLWIRFVKSLIAFLRLSWHGFHISHSEVKEANTGIYRFWWNDRMIEDICDIDHVDGHFNTMMNGSCKRLGKK